MHLSVPEKVHNLIYKRMKTMFLKNNTPRDIIIFLAFNALLKKVSGISVRVSVLFSATFARYGHDGGMAANAVQGAGRETATCKSSVVCVIVCSVVHKSKRLPP